MTEDADSRKSRVVVTVYSTQRINDRSLSTFERGPEIILLYPFIYFLFISKLLIILILF